MKDRVREAAFNLVGPQVVGKHALDLFAGTGALGLEALSRGANSATFIERHVPTAQIIRKNITTLGVENRTELFVTSAFVWAKRDLLLPIDPWLVFCSPPYRYYTDREADMLGIIERLMQKAPPASTLVVEASAHAALERLPTPNEWDVRTYPPATLAIWNKPKE